MRCRSIASLALAILASAAVVSGGGRLTPAAVHLEGRALADAGGPFPALGATLFWGLWGEAHDSSRLDANLRWLAGSGVDYVRILAMVGGESWEDRPVNPSAPDYWAVVDRFLARLERHHLRAQVTIFAGAQAMMPDPSRRREFARLWAERVEREPDRFLFLEVANEHYKNGIEDVAELRALGVLIAARTNLLVALSAPAHGRACEVYAGAGADLATIHYPRDVGGDSWKAVRQPWTYPGEYDDGCPGQLPVAVNNEPIGPRSSVADDDDPLRLVLSYVTTFVSGNAAYVVHAGAGVRGGGRADRERGRQSNLFGVPRLDVALAGIAALRRHLPPDLANWQRLAPADDGFLLDGVTAAVDRGDLVGAYAASHGGRFVAVVLGLRRAVTVTARRNVQADVLDPLTGNVIRTLTARAGETLTLEPRAPGAQGDGFVLISR